MGTLQIREYIPKGTVVNPLRSSNYNAATADLYPQVLSHDVPVDESNMRRWVSAYNNSYHSVVYRFSTEIRNHIGFVYPLNALYEIEKDS